jgi:hypothetical protein
LAFRLFPGRFFPDRFFPGPQNKKAHSLRVGRNPLLLSN